MKAFLLSIGCLSLCGCINMEMRGGMVPQVLLSGKPESEKEVFVDSQVPLRSVKHIWPQFRGPNRDGKIPLQTVKVAWKKKPVLRWMIPCGLSHSSIILDSSRVFTIEQQGEEETLFARDLNNGEEIWRFSLSTKWNDLMSGTGPRSTPTLHQGKLYVIFSNGTLARIDAKTGLLEWRVQAIEEEYEFPEWGISGSPLVWNDLIILNHGGEKSAARAHDLHSGKLVWRSDFRGSGVYPSPVLAEFFGEKHLLVAVAGRVGSLNPKNGKTRWEHPWKIFLNNALIAQPTQLDNDRLLLSAGYGKGAECLKIEKSKSGYTISSAWKSKNFKTKFSSPVLKDGFLYGFNENSLTCLNAKNGELQWRGEKYGYGKIFLADKHLLILGNTGVLSVVRAEPAQFTEVYSGQLLSDVRCWNGPALAGGYLVAKNGQEIACFDWAAN